MSTKKILQNLSQKEKTRLLAYFSMIALLVIIIISFASFNIGKNQKSSNNSPIPVVDISKVSSTQRILGQTTYNWTGKIVEKNNFTIVVNISQKDSSGNNTLKDIIATINNNTQIIKWDLTNPPSTDKLNNNKSQITFNDLKVGQEVVVKSSNDINKNNEITASDINLLITSNN